MVAVIHYGAGNIGSVANLLGRMGCPFQITSDPGAIRSADRVILPGVGEAAWAMKKLREQGLDRVVLSLTQPVLGICIGMQLMCSGSEEGGATCLGLFDTPVRKLAPAGLKVPHMGWDTVEELTSPLTAGIPEGSFFYYVHSYAADPCDQTVAVTTYGQRFSAALHRGNFYGVQFHPEKSGAIGQRLMKNFLEL